MNKYSEWIFWYLTEGFLQYKYQGWFLDNSLGVIHEDFRMKFQTKWWGYTNLKFLIRQEEKLSFYWLLAHVDQETADEMLK